MELQTVVGDAATYATDALVVGIWADDELDGAAAAVDEALGGALGQLLDDGGLSGQAGRVGLIHTLGKLPAKRVAVAGLGKRDALTPDTLRRAAGEACRRVSGDGATQVALAGLGQGGPLDTATISQVAVEGVLLAARRFDPYKSASANDAGDISDVSLLADAASRETVQDGGWAGQVIGDATNLARELVDTPPCDLPPAALADLAAHVAEVAGLTCRTLGPAELERMGFNLVLAVNAGSAQDPAVIVLEYTGAGPAQPLGLVGKGVCFDSGGLSIKTSTGMMTMKGDMGGAAAVLATIKAVAELELPLNVTVVIPAVQNLIGGQATRPGDIVKSLSGKFVEILNTDAEGRLILADALTYASRELQLAPVVDIATLTGACMRALGPVSGGLFGTDDGLLQTIRQAGLDAGEKLWILPLDDEYGELMKSDVADLRNISKSDCGGASSAAMFLKEFVHEAPWAHLDVAGLMFADSEKHYQPKGATGYGVRTLIGLCRRLALGAG